MKEHSWNIICKLHGDDNMWIRGNMESYLVVARFGSKISSNLNRTKPNARFRFEVQRFAVQLALQGNQRQPQFAVIVWERLNLHAVSMVQDNDVGDPQKDSRAECHPGGTAPRDRERAVGVLVEVVGDVAHEAVVDTGDDGSGEGDEEAQGHGRNPRSPVRALAMHNQWGYEGEKGQSNNYHGD